jgi:indolepyruvate ferredoxin oxidoreductase, beta subunit
MKYDIILAGVGGQGVLSLAAVIAGAALKSGLVVRQSEVHGMAQRGGSVLAHMRISDLPIHGDLVPRGRADMLLAMEPMEALRYTGYLSPNGVLISAVEPVINIPNYPAVEKIIEVLGAAPHSRLIPVKELALKAGHPKTANLVLVGAASRYIPIPESSMTDSIETIFGSKGEAIVEMNRRAFSLGRDEGS